MAGFGRQMDAARSSWTLLFSEDDRKYFIGSASSIPGTGMHDTATG
jgi:hypothetical protein